MITVDVQHAFLVQSVHRRRETHHLRHATLLLSLSMMQDHLGAKSVDLISMDTPSCGMARDQKDRTCACEDPRPSIIDEAWAKQSPRERDHSWFFISLFSRENRFF
jgi:hypothetical protein